MESMNDELERTWKDTVATCCKELFKISAVVTEENHKNIIMICFWDK
jgi:hypothetical protein